MACVYTPDGGCNGGGGTAGGGYPRLLSLEQSCKVYCYQAYYGPVSGGRLVTGSTGLQVVVGAGRGGCGEDATCGSGGRKYGVGGGDRKYINVYRRLIRWQYTVANEILGMEPNNPLAYAPRFELHNPIMSIIGGHRGRIDRENDEDHTFDY